MGPRRTAAKAIGLVACAGKKLGRAAEARSLYTSALFRLSRRYVEAACDDWYILSAKHGLVPPGAVIRPYDESLRGKPRGERVRWAERVLTSLRRQVGRGDRVIVLAGRPYREFLTEPLERLGCSVEVPMEGMRIGRQLQWLRHREEPPDRVRDLDRLYRLLAELERGIGGRRQLSDCSGGETWPESGVYFFFEDGELRRGSRTGRIVRVGTHRVSRGSRATLWARLRAHRGSSAGLGNHRGSVFRLHVGSAIARRDPRLACRSWAREKSAPPDVRRQEVELERAASDYIGNLSILWVAVDGEASTDCDRAYLESNLIALIGGGDGPVDPPTGRWLGAWSADERIRRSGLWNLNCLDHEYESRALDVFEKYVQATLGKSPMPESPLAPAGWRGPSKAPRR